ncbi:PfkB family carbohydrate kinase [Georgenia sp. TF02-10]|uniref:PfkB family carbohydrate kinase n=1 Tax=Georgenia sp. TF02-10 TaxID=2917725 RepID=UPI0027388751|nr:PfkB family carbohydrate kinase [Georgenia sp. TF02-10]
MRPGTPRPPSARTDAAPPSPGTSAGLPSAGTNGRRAPHVVVVGDVVLDRDVDGRVERLSPDAPVPVVDVTGTRDSPGGAGLAALLCAAAGARVTLLAPVAADDAGARLTAQLERHLTVLPLPHEGPTRRKTRVRSAGQSLVRVDDGGPGIPGPVPRAAVAAALAEADAVLVSCYGAGVTRDPVLRELLAGAARRTRLVWDPHPRGGEPVPGATLVVPNLAEARGHAPDRGAPPDVLATDLAERWAAEAVCVTAGATGAFLGRAGQAAAFVPATAADGDPCGAGDQLAAVAATALAGGALVSEAVERAVAAATAWVAGGGAEGFRARRGDGAGPGTHGTAPAGSSTDGAAPITAAAADGPPPGPGADDLPPAPAPPSSGPIPAEPAELARLAARLRADGGTLVATGGCFDIVHAGHVATLQAARRLGGHLVVLMNSDASITRLKGPGRPVVRAADRARVLQAFDCVDAVVVFDEDDPATALAHLRPDVWAKGGDYGGAPLPEADVVRDGGGRVVLLPYLGGRSTTSIIERSGLARARTGRTTA